MKPDKALNIARGVFGLLAAVFALITFILFGVNMDYANFPGSNLKLAVYPDGDEKEGQLKQVLGGYELEPTATATCSNFVDSTADAITLSFGADANQLCKNTEDPTDNLNADWNRGWVVAPECARTSDENECAPFGASSPLAWFGFLTFGTLSIQVILFGAHTCYLLVNDELKNNDTTLTVKNALSTLKNFNRNVQAWLALTIVWLIVGMALMLTAAFAWDSMCDKIDTGLGRRVSDASGTTTRACATSTCTTSFGSFFATMVVAVVWYRLPHIAQWFGCLEAN